MLNRLVLIARRIGIEARLPAEIMFLEKFYESQTLSAEKLMRSSFSDTDPKADIFTELPELIDYYISRWEHLNIIDRPSGFRFNLQEKAEEFDSCPEKLFDKVLAEQEAPFLQQSSIVNSLIKNRRATDQKN